MSLLSEEQWKEIECSINVLELAPKLIECGLLEIGDSVEDTRKYRSQFVDEIRRGEEIKLRLFSSCFNPTEQYDHMGHAYIACLLHGKRFADDGAIALSMKYKRAFTTNMSKVVDLLSVKCLIPHLVEAGLLTPDEVTALSHNSDKKGALDLFKILTSKGPTAFSILVECIHDEKQHSGHNELYELVTEDLPGPTPNPCTPCELSYEDTLTCSEYHERRHKFERYYHNAQWDKCKELAEECMKCTITEIQVIGNLELALSYIFRVRENEVLYHVTQAENLCKNIENSNRTFLSGRCKYLLALLYHYLDKPEYASMYIKEAKSILFEVEIGEDKSFAMYCDAIISAKTLTDKSSQYEFNEVTKKFEISLSYSACTYDMDILVIYSFLRLGRLYLGRTETRLTKCTDAERLQASKDCQQKLLNDYFSQMDDRCKGLYYLNQCDIYMNYGQYDMAIESIEQAKYYAERSQCPPDICAVQMRLETLHT